MSRIVYLMGAGASRGKRVSDDRKNTDNSNDIIEGLPLVNEIPQRLEHWICVLREHDPEQNLKNTIFPLGDTGGTGYDEARDLLIKDLLWLKSESARHATIDTFAKKLYLKNQMTEFYKVELLLTLFFIFEQLFGRVDGRYDTFLASILTRDLKLPSHIKVLTWNYDSQFELTFKEYSSDDYCSIRNKLLVYDAKNDVPVVSGVDALNDSVNRSTHNANAFNNHCIIKLNGTANFKEQFALTDYVGQTKDDILKQILDRFIKYRPGHGDNKYTRLSFAWDSESYIDSLLNNQLKNELWEAKVLVVIGYTFPFFNREIDRKVFELMPNLKTIYVQDPNAENIMKNVDPVLSDLQRANGINVNPIINTDQFFLPSEI